MNIKRQRQILKVLHYFRNPNDRLFLNNNDNNNFCLSCLGLSYIIPLILTKNLSCAILTPFTIEAEAEHRT
jgi:hypothetical protein